jgi:nitroreductase
MEKPVKSKYPLAEDIKNRWSPRALSSEPVPSEKLLSVLEAGRWAPSCFNDQPWFYLIAEKDRPEEFDRMLSCLVEKNQRWARNAWALVIGVVRVNFSTREKENRHAFHDLGMSIMNMMTQAVHEGLYIHAMAGFSSESSRRLFSIPDGYEPVTALAIGYPGNPEDLPEEFREAEYEERERKPLQSFVFEDSWEKRWGKIK